MEVRPSPGRVDTLVGRDVELAALGEAVASTSAGRPALVLVTGEPGIGKTRLVDESAMAARAAGMRVVRGAADPSLRAPMELWRGVFHTLKVSSSSDPALPAEERRWEQLETLAEALASAAPVMVVLDDLHWADAMAVWVLEQLPRALGDAAVAVVATSREREPEMPRLDGVQRVSRSIRLEGLDVAAVGRLAEAAATATSRPVDATELHARTGGNPLFVRELLRAPDGGVIDDVLDGALVGFDPDTRRLLATAALAGAGTPLSVVAAAASMAPADATARLDSAVRAGVLDEVDAAGVRFHHDLLSEAAGRGADAATVHTRLAAAWDDVGGLDGRAAAAGHRLRATEPAAVPDAVAAAVALAEELVAAGRQESAAAVLRAAREAARIRADRPELGARVSLDLARVLRGLGDLDRSLEYYREAARLARDCTDPIVRARAEVGANLWADAFTPDPARVRRLEEALAGLPDGELRLRAALLSRLAVVAGADVGADDRGARARAWAEEAVTVARRSHDDVLVAQALINRTMSPVSRAELDDRIHAADEVVGLAEHVGRPDLALYGHQRRFSHHLNHGDVGTANQALSRAELLAGLLPSPGWRQRTLVQRTTLLAVTGNRAAAVAAMEESVRVGTGHIEPVILYGAELMHRLMLVELYRAPVGPRLEEVYRLLSQMTRDVPSPLLQVQRGYAAQLVGDGGAARDMLARYAADPDVVQRSMTGDHLLRILGDAVARAGAAPMVEPVYAALLPYAGLLNVGGGLSAGLPVDDVLGRLALVGGDDTAAVRHGRDAVAYARSVPSLPMLVQCLQHLADALSRVGDTDEAEALRAEADMLAPSSGLEPSGPRLTAPTPATTGRHASMRRESPSWVIASPLGSARLTETAGIAQLARLLARPGVEISALDLSGRADAPVHTDLGPALDAQAKRTYRRRLLELQAEVDDATDAGDATRAEQAHVEIDALMRELRRAVGLGGRDRPTGSDAERARVNVVRSLRRAITAVRQQAPQLAAHLDDAVRTGRYCLYLPDPTVALSWTVDAGES